MAVLSWGKCSLFHATSTDGAPTGEWEEIDTPKEDTTKITTTAGDETTANEEGGAVVDVRFNKSTYQLEFDLFVKKGVDRPFDDDDGVITGEHAWRIIPEDEECTGCQIDRSVLRVEESYSTAEGILLHHVARCLKPASGKTVKPYVASEETA